MLRVLDTPRSRYPTPLTCTISIGVKFVYEKEKGKKKNKRLCESCGVAGIVVMWLEVCDGHLPPTNGRAHRSTRSTIRVVGIGGLDRGVTRDMLSELCVLCPPLLILSLLLLLLLPLSATSVVATPAIATKYRKHSLSLPCGSAGAAP